MGRISGLIRWWRSLDSERSEALAAPPDAGALEVARREREQRNAKVAAALKKSQQTRLQLFFGSLGLSGLLYVLWTLPLGVSALVADDKLLSSNIWDAFPASGWDLGLSAQTATPFVFAALALVAAVTIASSTLPTPENDSAPSALAGWSGWLMTLTLASLLTSTMAFTVAGSQMAVRPKNSVLLIFMALVACWLSSGIHRQADERIEDALRHSEREKKQALQQRIEHRIPSVSSRNVRRTAVAALITPLIIALISALPYLMLAWLHRHQQLDPTPTAEFGIWLVILTWFTAMTLVITAAAWYYWTTGSRWTSVGAWAAFAVSIALEGSYLTARAANSTETLAWSPWASLSVWLLLTTGICVTPRWNPLTQVWLVREWKRATERLHTLTTQAQGRTANT